MERVLEPEVMDTWEEAVEYDAMDFREVNQAFAEVAIRLTAHFVNALGLDKGDVLDVGTGTAQIPILIAQRCPDWQITGIDLSENMLILGQKNIEKAGLQHQIQLQKIDAKKLPYSDHSFDVIISNSIVHHLPDPLPFFQELKRVLKPNGGMLLRDLLRPADQKSCDRLVEQYAGDCNPHQKQLFHDSLKAAFTLEEIKAMLEAVGLTETNLYQSSDRHWTAEKGIG